jgi:hypothetical protein
MYHAWQETEKYETSSGSLIIIGNIRVALYTGLLFKYYDFPLLSFNLPSMLRSVDTDSTSDHKERLRGVFGTDDRIILNT